MEEKTLQVLVLIGGAALAAYAIHRLTSRVPETDFDDYESGWYEGEEGEPMSEEEMLAAWEDEDRPGRLAVAGDYASRGAGAAWRGAKWAGRGGYGLAKKHAPTVWKHTKRAGSWAGKQVGRGYEAAASHDWAGTARRVGGEAMKVGQALDELTYMEPPRRVASAVPPGLPRVAPTVIDMPAYTPRKTVFQEPLPAALAPNRRHRSSRRRASR